VTPAAATPDLAVEVGAQLRAARGERSLRAVAAELGIRHGALIYLERGEDNPTLARLARIADAYGCEVEVRLVPRRARRSA
jgi:transcriptional regulator with XRE-family HTH domain